MPSSPVAPALTMMLAPDIARHDHDGISEVHDPTLAVGETPVIQNLEQDVEHVGMGLLDLVE